MRYWSATYPRALNEKLFHRYGVRFLMTSLLFLITRISNRYVDMLKSFRELNLKVRDNFQDDEIWFKLDGESATLDYNQ